MKKLLLAFALSAFSLTAAAQVVSSSSYPVYERVYEQGEYCRDVVVSQPNYNPGAAVVGAVIGYQLGRGYDRHRRSGVYYNGYHYDRGRGYSYSDRMNGYRDSRTGRYTGAVVGGLAGGYVGNSYSQQTVCEPSRGQYREVFVGYRVVTRYPDGRMVEEFKPAR